jgi:hypothetical protein
VVYGPGLVCTRCLHPINLAVVVPGPHRLDLLGETCAEAYQPQPWLDAMATRKFFIEKGDFAVDESLSPEMRKHFRVAALYNQIFSEETFMLDMLVRFRNHEALTDQFRSDIEWFIECLGEYKGWLVRRDQLSRLRMLLRLGDGLGKNEKLIKGLIDLVQDKGLTSKQNAMVWAIQNDHDEELLPFSYQFLSQWPPENGVISLD